MVNYSNEILDKFFNAKSIAVVGVSSKENAFGTLYFRALMSFGYKGKLYPVNQRGGTLGDIQLYPSVKDIPDEIDLALVMVPAKGVNGVLEECVAKGIKCAIVITGGFSETGEKGKKYEQEIIDVAGKGIKIIGPNCFGIYVPKNGMTIISGKDFPKEAGGISLITQSGQFTEMIVMQTRGLGLRFSKVVSFGNACDLNESDLLEYLANDPDTQVITAYIEGVKNGPRFLEAVRKAARIKPVIIWKMGMTQAGSKAASSHTGSLAGSEAVWKAFFAQTGAIRVDSMEELIDNVIACLNMLPNAGRKVAVISGSGGGAVIGADVCEYNGLETPTFPVETQEKIRSLLPPIGTNVKNPVDLSNPVQPYEVLKPVFEEIAGLENIDALFLGRMFLSVDGPTLIVGRPKSFAQGREPIKDLPLYIQEKYHKPVIVTLSEEVNDASMYEFEIDRRNLREYYLTHGVPVYTTVERAGKALANIVKYKERLKS